MPTAAYHSPVGLLVLRYRAGRVTALSIGRSPPVRDARLGLPVNGWPPPAGEGASHSRGLYERVVAWLDAYFEGGSLPTLPRLAPAASAFQARLRRALLAIPPGQTRSYGDLARQLDSSPRAVGQACRANPLPILVPCHRVVSARGVGGFMGQEHSPVKGWLLEHERGR